ncbi:MAG: type II CAAX endopeptidase family protein [Acidobacteria bacterium]|nr:type II CAAX endopeptidase family protein [Acidobacteriota bacterium]
MPPESGSSDERGRTEIVVFLGLTFALSSIFYYLILRGGSLASGGGAAAAGLMWCPGIAAMVTVTWFRRNLRGLGWGAGPWRYWLWGYGSPILYAGVVYIVVWTTGLGAIDEEVLQRLTASKLLTLIALGTAMSGLTALGEEIGWRGFLTPRLHARFGFTRSTLITGLIWAAWHYPLLLFGDYNSGTPWWFGLTCFTILVVGISFFFAWLRLTSASVWPAVWLHASHNLWIQGFFDRLTADTGPTEWWTGEFGAGLALAALVVSAIVLKRLPRRGW